ncbi:hypothetical protein E2C01_005398 [Portunus trituberculatus]|uniref:Uncharacterized protein n=1 Tax=Portunus trituberculatus TaxID=210409 RepID=A0A5B7CVF4_PORTR|nr:hypothetical protein [Portunus trituberculatus]
MGRENDDQTETTRTADQSRVKAATSISSGRKVRPQAPPHPHPRTAAATSNTQRRYFPRHLPSPRARLILPASSPPLPLRSLLSPGSLRYGPQHRVKLPAQSGGLDAVGSATVGGRGCRRGVLGGEALQGTATWLPWAFGATPSLCQSLSLPQPPAPRLLTRCRATLLQTYRTQLSSIHLTSQPPNDFSIALAASSRCSLASIALART